jgi:hypothetical protein
MPHELHASVEIAPLWSSTAADLDGREDERAILHFDFSVRFARRKSLTRLQPPVPATMSVEKARRRTHSKNSGDLFARFTMA